jgi:hypothetical protein
MRLRSSARHVGERGGALAFTSGVLAPDAGAAALAADHRLAPAAVERDTATGANTSAGPATDGREVGLAPDQGTAGAESGLEFDAARAAVAVRDNQRCP